jgi:hypothetical protein
MEGSWGFAGGGGWPQLDCALGRANIRTTQCGLAGVLGDSEDGYDDSRRQPGQLDSVHSIGDLTSTISVCE